MSDWPLTTIVSGAIAGAERGALDAAIELDLQYGGWRAPGEPIPAIYAERMKSAGGSHGMFRRLNVQDSDGTLIVSLRPELAGAAALVDQAVEQQRASSLHICLPALGSSQMPEAVARQVRDWIREDGIAILHVSGPSEGDEPGIQEATHDMLVWIFEDEIDVADRGRLR